MKIAESGVLPAVRQTAPDALVLADGFSCRTQIEQGGTGRGALHLAEALALALDGPPPADHPEKAAARPAPPGTAATRASTGTVAAAGVLAAAAAYALARRRR
jgi:hypothetical protein